MQKLNPYTKKLRMNLIKSFNSLQAELESKNTQKTLPELRKQISFIDQEIIELLAKRFKFAKEIGKLKKTTGLSIENKELEKKIFVRYKKLADKNNADSDLIKKIFRLIITESKTLQKKRRVFS